jgi:carbamate kinase
MATTTKKPATKKKTARPAAQKVSTRPAARKAAPRTAPKRPTILEPSRRVAVVAIGGNSLIKDPKHQTVEDQYLAAKETTYHIADMIEAGWEVAIGHGNGPQVGFILRRSEIAHKVEGMHEVPLEVCGADSQGAIGYALQQNLQNELFRRGIKKNVATVITQVLVDREDTAFKNPSKPIGGFMDQADAKRREADLGWSVVEDAGRGWRRVVASPLPKMVVELETVKALIDAGVVVVTVGGGGIPVIDTGKGDYAGIAAVIDKDYASSLLAREIKADLLLISTAVEKVAIHFGKPEQQWLDRMTLAEARQYLAEGTHFAKGSMAPKIQAIIWYLENGGKRAIITNPENIGRALRGETGTHLVP